MKTLSEVIGRTTDISDMEYRHLKDILDKPVVVKDAFTMLSRYGQTLAIVVELDGKDYVTFASSDAIKDKLALAKDSFPVQATFYARQSKATGQTYFDVK